MKKTVLIVVVAVMQTVTALGQTPSRDTLPCGERQRDYFYSEWYDTTNFYLRPDCYSYTAPEFPNNLAELMGFGGNEYYAFQQFSPRRIRVKGIWGMVAQYPPSSGVVILDTARLPEYFYLYLRDSNGTPPVECKWSDKFLMLVDSVRWDTAQPKMMCVKQTADGRKNNMYCHVYEALFDTVYTLAGEFWIGGSTYSWREDPGAYPRTYYNFPTEYKYYKIINQMNWHPSWYSHAVYTSMNVGTAEGPWKWWDICGTGSELRDGMTYSFGPFGVILDEPQYYVEVSSADTASGIAKPTAYFPAGTYQTITAVANHCYRFSHWSDGDTTNPRTILVTQDTSFTAYFDTVPNIYEVSARSNDNTLGRAVLREWPRRPVEPPVDTNQNLDSLFFPFYRVIGSDTVYCEGDSAIFWARPSPGAYFWYWNDSVRENPRTIIVRQDTMLTAIFRREVPPEYVRPCPRVGKPLVVVMDTDEVLLAWAWGASTLHVGGWEVAWGLAGTPPDSCAIIPCVNYDRILDGLEVGVRYVAYVRAVCRHNGTPYYSDWSDSVEIYFPYIPHRYTVTVAADYAERGRVYGGGEYDEGDLAVLTAYAWSPYGFLQWDDGDTANPRYIVVTQDTSFRAIFVEAEDTSDHQGLGGVVPTGRLFRLVPNPASGKVRCLTAGEDFGGGVLTVVDVAGREVLRLELSRGTRRCVLDVSGLPSGTYFVTLATAEGTSTQKLVVEN